MKKEELLKILEKKENENLEFKEAKNNFSVLGSHNNRKSIYGYCVALGNEGGGKLILGVNDNGEIVETKALENIGKIKSQIFNKLQQRIEIKEIFIENKRVVVIKIPSKKTGSVFKFYGTPLMRIDEELREMDDETLLNILNENKKDWSAEIIHKAGIIDLDLTAIKKAREGFIRKNPKIDEEEIKKWSDVVFLNKAKITIKEKITKAAILLLGKPESEHFISPANAKITWILKDKDGIEKDYEHFSCPLILAVDEVFKKIRNLRYRYIFDGTLFPDEVDKYDSLTIREAINNSIAHQDYEKCGKINVVESENDSLIFSNLGSFIPQTIENVIESDSPTEYYRNRFLADAMVNLNMIDTIGSGIKNMFVSQKKKFFPLPEYDLSDNRVKLTIIGKVLDIKYAEKLAQLPDLDLKTVMALDKVQKKKKLTKEENKAMRSRGLIEGRSPNLHISLNVAIKTGEQSNYMKIRGIEDEYAQKMILDYLKEFKKASKSNFDKMLLDKLPDVLGIQQKKNKIKNLLQKLKKDGEIEVNPDRSWSLPKKNLDEI